MKGIFRLLSKPVVLYSTLAVLVLGVIALIYWNFTLIETNVSAQAQIEERETAVIEHSKKLKEIAEMYHKANGRYPGSCDEIVEFAQNGFVVEKNEIFDPNNLGKFEAKKGYVDPTWGKYSKDTVWHEPNYRLLALREKETNPSFDNIKIDTIYARETILKKYTDVEIANLRYIPYSDKVEFEIDTLRGEYNEHRFRCHAPYAKFLDTKEYSQQFWNFIEDKFNYYVKNAEVNPDKLKLMAADGAYVALTSKGEDGMPKYFVGSSAESRRYIDINFFGVTFGDLDKTTLDGSWEDQRAKK